MSRDELIEADSVPSLQPIFTNHLDPLNSDMKFPKTDSECCPLISIITVVFNGESYIEKTILSVLNQTYKNIDYIIVDGGSQDNTLNIISKYKPYLSHLISEPDDGIYDAMNKGIFLSRGKYVNFLNSGDLLVDANVLAKAVDFMSLTHCGDVVCGNALYNHGSFEVLLTPDFDKVPFVFCHQAVFYKSQLIKKFLYSLEYKFSADSELMYRVIEEGFEISQVDLVVVRAAVGVGKTFSNLLLSTRELYNIPYVKRYHPKSYIFRKMLKARLIDLLQKFLPLALFNFLIYLRSKSNRDIK